MYFGSVFGGCGGYWNCIFAMRRYRIVADSTLEGYTKAELIKYVRELEAEVEALKRAYNKHVKESEIILDRMLKERN